MITKFSKIINSGLYVPGNQQRMLNKCALAGTSLIVPDLEDAVPQAEKDKARILIKENLANIRETAGANVTITVRANSLDSGMFF